MGMFSPYNNREEIDRWLVSRYNSLLKYVTNAYDEYDLTKVVRALTNFVSEDLSNWYIRRNRNRFWGSEFNDSKKSVYITTYEVLVGLSKITAPIAPYITEEIYTKLTNEYSVHTADFPKYDESLIDLKLEEKMDLVRDIISIGRNVREEAKIKVRTPLKEAIIEEKVYSKINDLVPLVKEELNIKEILSVSDLATYMELSLKPNYKLVGKILGPQIKDFEKWLNELSKEDISKLNNNESLTFEDKTIDKEMVEIRVSAKEGFNVGTINNLFIVLNTNLTADLINEGHAREFISKIQNLRKNNEFEVSDRIIINYEGNEFDNVIIDYEDYIKNETLAVEINKSADTLEELDINGIKVKVKINKVS